MGEDVRVDMPFSIPFPSRFTALHKDLQVYGEWQAKEPSKHFEVPAGAAAGQSLGLVT